MQLIVGEVQIDGPGMFIIDTGRLDSDHVLQLRTGHALSVVFIQGKVDLVVLGVREELTQSGKVGVSFVNVLLDLGIVRQVLVLHIILISNVEKVRVLLLELRVVDVLVEIVAVIGQIILVDTILVWIVWVEIVLKLVILGVLLRGSHLLDRGFPRIGKLLLQVCIDSLDVLLHELLRAFDLLWIYCWLLDDLHYLGLSLWNRVVLVDLIGEEHVEHLLEEQLKHFLHGAGLFLVGSLVAILH